MEKLDDLLVRYLAFSNYKYYVNRMNLQENEKILEVGCGGGNLSRFLAEKLSLGELVCIDNSGYWVNKASKRLGNFKNIELEVEDILMFNRKNYFDSVVVNFVLHDIDKRKNTIDIIIRSLKNKGRIFIKEPTRKNHGISSDEIRLLMTQAGCLEKFSREGYSFPLRGEVYESVFSKESQ